MRDGSDGRAGQVMDDRYHRPLYARMLRLQHLEPSGFLCFVFLEGAIALGILLGLAELVSWWGVLVLPVLVAAMVKLNDVVAGAVAVPAPRAGRAMSVPRPAVDDVSATASAGAPRSPRDPGPADEARSVLRSAMSPALPTEFPWPSDVTLAGATTVDLRRPAAPAQTMTFDASALNGPPASGQWADHLDNQHQRARQSASRHYE